MWQATSSLFWFLDVLALGAAHIQKCDQDGLLPHHAIPVYLCLCVCACGVQSIVCVAIGDRCVLRWCPQTSVCVLLCVCVCARLL